MNNNESTNEYMLLFRGTDWTRDLSPEQIQNVMNQWKNWFEGLQREGKLKAGQPLEPTGKFVSGKNGRIVSDGPFMESKEALGGYFLLTVDSFDKAVAIAKACPGLEYGCVVEVRQVAAQCSCSAKALAATEGQLAHA